MAYSGGLDTSCQLAWLTKVRNLFLSPVKPFPPPTHCKALQHISYCENIRDKACFHDLPLIYAYVFV